MEVHCQGCAGCCLDWRPLLEADDGRDVGGRGAARSGSSEDEQEGRTSRRVPLDGDYNFVALTRDEVRAFLESGAAPALTPRFWRVDDEREGVEIDGHRVAAVAGRPTFFVGLRKPPKPVAPFGREEPAWLPTCVFLDPTTLQCRIHDSDRFPDECGAYPEHNLALEQETECERVESQFGGERLLEAGHDDPEGLLLGPQALGAKLFCHPRPDDLEGIVDRLAAGELTPADRAECLAVAAASSPGTLATSPHHYERGYERALQTLEGSEDAAAGDSATVEDGEWVGPAIDEWHRRRAAAGGTVPSPSIARTVEERRGAPETPGWDALE
ncbi:YkgJ family cysteine cluster protein [Natronococcus wangiae]|uniref:YkgJ family cysteine cluster protein n=1 Tax=Natronococcus wangiae TaxID=3068275 RepID=UPI00273EA908|nr:YkgJ family cysteine cluster protein [Natronococcus sp. AD5]